MEFIVTNATGAQMRMQAPNEDLLRKIYNLTGKPPITSIVPASEAGADECPKVSCTSRIYLVGLYFAEGILGIAKIIRQCLGTANIISAMCANISHNRQPRFNCT